MSEPTSALARLEIRETIERYFSGIDRRDLDFAVAAFAPQGVYHLGAYEVHLQGREAIRSYLGRNAPLPATTHNLCNTAIEVVGETAKAATQAVAYLLTGAQDGGPFLVRGISYEDEFVRLDGRWLIAKRTHRTHWQIQTISMRPVPPARSPASAG